MGIGGTNAGLGVPSVPKSLPAVKSFPRPAFTDVGTLMPWVGEDTAATEGQILDLLLQPIINDATAVTELVQLPFYIIISDATAVAESSTVLLPVLLININQESTIVVSESMTTNIVMSLAVNDATTVSELQTVLLPVLLLSVGEDTTVTELVVVYWLITPFAQEITGVSDLFAIVMVPASPIFLSIGEDLAITDFNDQLLPTLNCTVNEIIITDDAAPIQIGAHGRESGPALLVDIAVIT